MSPSKREPDPRREPILRPLAEHLRRVHVACGMPSLRSLQAQTPYLGIATSSAVLNAKSEAKLDFAIAFHQACLEIAENSGVEVDQQASDQQLTRELWERQSLSLRELSRRVSLPPKCVLPPSSVRLIGRDHDLAWLDAEIGQCETEISLIALDGMPGVGKSELAIKWAWRNRERFQRGTIFLDLRGSSGAGPLTTSAALARLVAFFHDDTPADTYDGQLDQYRAATSAGGTCVILDNATDENQVRDLIPSAGCCIVTSREHMTGLVVRAGAKRAPVKPLDPAGGAELLGFRAKLLNSTTAARISERCGGLPLGLRLAAELLASAKIEPDDLLRSSSSEALLRRLDRATRDPTATMETLFGHSFGALSDEEFLAAEAVALAPCHEVSIELIATITCASIDVTDRAISRLIGSSLVTRTSNQLLSMHDLLREWMRVASPERSLTVRCRTYDFYSLVIDHVDRALLPSRGRSALTADAEAVAMPPIDTYNEAFEWSAAEIDNVVSVVHAAVADQRYSCAAALPHMLLSYCNVAKPYSRWIEMTEAVVAVLDHLDSPIERANVVNGLGIAYRELGDHAAAADLFEQAAQQYGDAGESAGRAMALSNLSVCCTAQGAERAAVDHLRQAGAALAESDDDFRKGIVAHNLAETLLELGELDEAIQAATQAYGFSVASGDEAGRATTMTTIAEVRFRLGQAAHAERLFREAQAIQRRLGDISGLAFTLMRLARLLVRGQRLPEAFPIASEARDIFVTLGDGRRVSECDVIIGVSESAPHTAE